MLRIGGREIRIGLLAQLSMMCLVLLVAMDIYMGWYCLPKVKGDVREALETRAREEAEIGWDTVNRYYEGEVSGRYTREMAQEYALSTVTGINFTAGESQGYFWVNDMGPVLLGDRMRPDLVGTDVGGYRDQKGALVFSDIVEICREEGEGWYTFQWQAAEGSSETGEKVSYVKTFEPWGWVIGTGVYSEGPMADVAALGNATWGLLIAIMVVTLALFVLVVHYILVRPLRSLVRTSEALAMGDVDQEIGVISRDEVGQVAEAYGKVIVYLRETAGAAGRVADGDLTVEVRPRSEKDALGNAFSEMVVRQRALIGKVKGVAGSVSEASRQLSRAAEQTAQAAQQITGTVTQVSKGALEQSGALQQTAGSVEQLSSAVAQIAAGAQEQAGCTEEASRIVKEVSAAIGEVAGNAQAGMKEWDSTAASAQEGAKKTHETVAGMDRVRGAMDQVSVKVTELGSRSQEIGQIVATIDDIAAQTNLLALNAAIEAARAGEQGRGFAVVADEVRKLAERSSLATKEIAGLIGGIQVGVREAVGAMQQGSTEVAEGYRLAADAGAALDDILRRSQNIGNQVRQISAAAQQLQALSVDMVEAIDRIDHVVGENATATEQMTQTAVKVSASVEAAAGVAGENSAASEEVSASVEEMSAQVEETLASAHSLAELAGEMDRAVAVFRT